MGPYMKIAHQNSSQHCSQLTRPNRTMYKNNTPWLSMSYPTMTVWFHNRRSCKSNHVNKNKCTSICAENTCNKLSQQRFSYARDRKEFSESEKKTRENKKSASSLAVKHWTTFLCNQEWIKGAQVCRVYATFSWKG